MSAAAESTETAVMVPQTLTERAVALLEKAVKKRDELVALVKGTEDIKAITNAAGRQQVHSALMVLADTRIAFEKSAKAARDKARVWTDELRAQELDLIGVISPEEKRLRELRDAWDGKIEAEKQAKIDAENNRKAAIASRIEGIRAAVVDYAGKNAEFIEGGIRELVGMEITPATFAEFSAPANIAREEVLTRLRTMHAERVTFEQAQEKLRLDAIAAAEQKAAQDAEAARLAKIEADKVAAERAELAKLRAENERLAKIEQDRQAESAKREREQLDRERQQQEAAAKVENDRMAAWRLEQEQKIAAAKAAQEVAAKADRDRIAAEEAAARAKIEAEQKAAREAQAKIDAEAKARREAEEARIAEARKKLADEQEAARLASLREYTAQQGAKRMRIVAMVVEEYEIAEDAAEALLRELFS